jgi:hypothetical protein
MTYYSYLTYYHIGESVEFDFRLSCVICRQHFCKACLLFPGLLNPFMDSSGNQFTFEAFAVYGFHSCGRKLKLCIVNYLRRPKTYILEIYLICDAAMDYLCSDIEDDRILCSVACWGLRLGSHWLL